jgi:FkbM family methyltransferase
VTALDEGGLDARRLGLDHPRFDGACSSPPIELSGSTDAIGSVAREIRRVPKPGGHGVIVTNGCLARRMAIVARLPSPSDTARRIAHLPGLHQLFTHPRVERLVAAALRAKLLDRGMRFFLREALGRRVGATYGLREARSVRFALRHGTPDVDAVDQMFAQRLLTAPQPVEDALAALGRPPHVADLGANIGLFGAFARLRWPDAGIVCVEADPVNVSVLRRTIEANGGDWQLIPAFAATLDGRITFAAGRFGLSRAVSNGELGSPAGVVEVEKIDVFPVLERADLVKVDIEGSEWEILCDARLGEIPAVALALEYHPQGCPRPANPRGLATELLANAGFSVQEGPDLSPAGHGSLWAWRSPS